jgi:uncharacterized protein
MVTHRSVLLLLYFSAWLSPMSVIGQVGVPALANHRVHDEGGILSQQVVNYLEQSLKSFEDSTSNQIAVLIVNSLEGESIDQFGIRVADQWKLGQKDKDNGVILLIALNDRKMRIEVGQGLEGPLPDAICNRIIRNEMAPAFRRRDYDGGVVAAVEGIRKAIKGEYQGTGPTQRKRGTPVGFIILIILIIFAMRRGNRGGGTGFLIGAALGSMGSRSGGSWGGGGFSGGGGGFGGGGSSGSW